MAVTIAIAAFATVADGRSVAPAEGPWIGATQPDGGNDSAAHFVVEGRKIRPYSVGGAFKAIIAPTTFKCNEALLWVKKKRIAIKNSKFTYRGKVVDKYGTSPSGIKGKLTWKGKFTSPDSVEGTVRLKTKVTPVWDKKKYEYKHKKRPCDTGKIPWTGQPEG